MLSLARIIQVLFTLIVFWLCSVRLDKAVYGTYQKIFVIAGFCSSLLALGLPLLIASLPAAQLGSLIRLVWAGTRKIYLFLFLGIALFVMIFLPILPLSTRCLLLALALTSSIYSVAEIFTIKKGKNRRVFLINLFYACAFLGIHYFFLYRVEFSLNALLGALVAAGILRIGFAGIGRKEDGEEVVAAPTTLYTRQWLYLSLNQGLDAFSGNIDNLFLLWLLSAPLFAIYFNGSYEIPVSGILVSAAGTFISVQVNQPGSDKRGILSLFRQVSLLLSCLLFPLFFFLQANAGPLFSWAFHGKYNDSVRIFLISSWILPLRIANYTVILQNRMQNQQVFQGTLLGLLSKLFLCLVFFAAWGVLGVAAAVVAGTGAQILFYLYHSARALDTRIAAIMPFRELLGFFVLCGVLFAGVEWCSSRFMPGSEIVFTSLLLAALVSLSLLVYYPRARKGLSGAGS